MNERRRLAVLATVAALAGLALVTRFALATGDEGVGRWVAITEHSTSGDSRATAPERGTTRAIAGRHAAGIAEHELEIETEIITELQADEGASVTGESRNAVRLHGRFAVTVIARDDRKTLVHFRVLRADLTGCAGEALVLPPGGAPRGGIAVRMTASWHPVQAAALPGTKPRTARLLRSLFADLHTFPVRATLPEGERQVVTGLSDDSGRYRAELWRAPAALLNDACDTVLHRRKTSYEDHGADAAAMLVVERSDAEAETGAGWLSRAAVRETLRVDAGGPGVLVSRRLDARLITSRRIAVPAQPGELAWGPMYEPFESSAPAAAAPPPLAELLAKLRSIAESDDLDARRAWECREMLVDRLLRAAPECEAVERLIRTEKDGAIRDWLIDVLGAAGGRGQQAATAALSRLLRTADAALTVSVLESAHQLGKHGDGIATRILELVTHGTPGVRVAAALAAGTLAGPTSADARGIFRTALGRTRSWAVANGRAEVYLDALANSRDREALRDAEPFLEHPDAATRQAAADALGHRPASCSRLARVAADDGDPLVRAAALRSLGRVAPDSPDAWAAVENALVRDRDPRARAAAVDALASLLPARRAQEALRAAAGHELHTGVRERIAQALRSR